MFISFCGAFAGFFGLSMGIFIHLALLTTTSSFGVPYLTPFAPLRKGVFKDDIISSPIWKQENRPVFLKPKKLQRAPHISRSWAKDYLSTKKDNASQSESDKA